MKSISKIRVSKDTLLTVASSVVLVGALAVAAHAGTDTTFSAATTQMTNWANGSLGKATAVGGVIFALAGLIAKFDWRLCAAPAGIGLTAAVGPTIVSGMATATF